LFLMTNLDVVCEVVNLGECTMEPLVVHLVYHKIHPRAVILIPLLALLQIAGVSLMSPIELSLVVTGLRLIKTLQQGLLLCRGLLLIRRFLLGSERYAHRQQNCTENNLFNT